MDGKPKDAYHGAMNYIRRCEIDEEDELNLLPLFIRIEKALRPVSRWDYPPAESNRLSIT